MKWEDCFTEDIVNAKRKQKDALAGPNEYSRSTLVQIQWLVKDLKASQEKAEKRLGDVYVNKNFVLAKTERHTGYPILFQTVENRMERLLKLAGLIEPSPSLPAPQAHVISGRSWGCFRGYYGKLGHSDDDTTRIIYRHVTKEMKKKASHKFDKLMRSLLMLAKC